MNKIHRTLVLMAMVVMLIVCVIGGRVVANSFVDNTNLDTYLQQKNPAICYCEIGYDEDTNIGFVDGDKIQDVCDIMNNTEVVKVHLNQEKKRSIYYECVLSTVEVDEVYQGNLKKGNEIDIFEPVDCRNMQIDCTDGYSLMQEGNQYILFLIPLKNAGYGTGEYVYAPVSTTYAKFLYNDSFPELFNEEQLEENTETTLYYNQYKQAEVYLYDEKMYNKYCKLKKQVMELVQ